MMTVVCTRCNADVRECDCPKARWQDGKRQDIDEATADFIYRLLARLERRIEILEAGAGLAP